MKRTVLYLIAFMSFSSLPFPTLGLYEDQAFKFDWHKSFIGNPESGRFADDDSLVIFNSNVRKISGNPADEKSGVLSALDADSGKIRYRHVLESGEKILDVRVTSKHVVTLSVTSALTSSSSNVNLRFWNPISGALLGEDFVKVKGPPVLDSSFLLGTSEVNVVQQVEKNSVRVSVFEIRKSGFSEDKEPTRVVNLSGDKKADILDCTNTESTFLCLSPQNEMVYFTAIPIKADFNPMPLHQLGMLPEYQAVSISKVAGTKDLASIKLKSASEGLIVVTTEAGKISNSHILFGSNVGSVSEITGCKNTNHLIKLEQNCGDDKCTTFSRKIKIDKFDTNLKKTHSLDFELGDESVSRIARAYASCEKDEGSNPVYQLIIQNEDGLLTSITPLANVMWAREESLGTIESVALVSTGLKDDDGTYDSDSGHPGHDLDLWGHFVKRIKHHMSLISSGISHLLEIRDLKELIIGEPDSNFDDFGLRKVIVAVTEKGKVLGLDNKSGSVLWKLIVNSKSIDSNKNIFVQRSALHFGYNAQCALSYKSRETGNTDVLFFNPINGEVVSKHEGKSGFDRTILLHQPDGQHLRPVLLLNTNTGNAEMVSRSSARILNLPKSFVVTKDGANTITGQKLEFSKNGEITMKPVWTLANPNTDSVTITGKSSEEKVHSQGRVMADRSVLFKYVNPNLALTLAEGKDSNDKNFINVYLVDLVSGRVVFSAHHKRVSGPYHVVHSENWAVYVYYNEKARRAELSSIELFEGHFQSNSTVFSSLTDNVSPLVERQAYILGPAHVSALKDTITEQGITSKTVILATNTGSVYSIPRQFLDPRRPNLNTPPEMREPGLPPYIPELTFPQEFILNYNQTVESPRGLATAPTGLESTSVVFVFGLDLYCTRIAPSKGFDLLKDDFDYSIISLVLMALIGASVLTKKLSQRKNLKQAWR